MNYCLIFWKRTVQKYFPLPKPKILDKDPENSVFNVLGIGNVTMHNLIKRSKDKDVVKAITHEENILIKHSKDYKQ